MTAISKAWVTVADSAVDPDSPLDTILLTALRDDLVHLREWLGASFTAGAVQDHNHDGVNSAIVEVGPNLLRNGSFESSSIGWTLTNYSGGSNAVQTTGAMHGKYCLAFTSTVLANGGGYAHSDEYVPVSPGRNYLAAALFKASGANISSQIEVIWYGSALAQLSLSTQLVTNTPTVQTLTGTPVVAPASAAYARVRVYGGVPAQGASTGTIYVDGCALVAADLEMYPRAAVGTYQSHINALDQVYSPPAAGMYKVLEFLCGRSGIYTTRLKTGSTAGNNTTSQIYKNGVAYGTSHVVNATATNYYNEDLEFLAGDLVQVYVSTSGSWPTFAVTSNLRFLEGRNPANFAPSYTYL